MDLLLTAGIGFNFRRGKREMTQNFYMRMMEVKFYPLSYGVPVRERYGSTLLPATREQHDPNCT